MWDSEDLTAEAWWEVKDFFINHNYRWSDEIFQSWYEVNPTVTAGLGIHIKTLNDVSDAADP